MYALRQGKRKVCPYIDLFCRLDITICLGLSKKEGGRSYEKDSVSLARIKLNFQY